MFSKLQKLRETQLEKFADYTNVFSTDTVVSKIVEFLVEKAANLYYEKQDEKPVNIQLKCTVVDSIKMQDNQTEIKNQKENLMNSIRKMQRMNFYLLTQYIGVKVEYSKNTEQTGIKSKGTINDISSEVTLKILAETGLQNYDSSKWKGQIKGKDDFLARAFFCCQLLQAVSYLHEHELSFFPHNIEEVIFMTKGEHIKMATHKFRSWRDTAERQIQQIRQKQATKIKKSALANRSTKYVAPQFLFKSVSIKDIRLNDVWKVGLFVLGLLSGEDLSKEVLGLEGIEQDKCKEYKMCSQEKQIKLKKYLKATDVTQLMKMLSILPADRKDIRAPVDIFRAILQEKKESFNIQTFNTAKKRYLQEDSLKTYKLVPEVKPGQDLLTADHKKKLSEYFKKVQNRNVKGYQFIFRGSHSKFSCRCFYQATYGRKCLLLVFAQKKEKKKLLCFAQQSFDLSKCNGIFGGFVKDLKKLSFIFSPQQGQFCKLKNAQKALGVSYVQGPVIGEGDITVSDGALINTCRFPLSYEPTGKVKKWLKSDRFELQEYDVYQCTF